MPAEVETDPIDDQDTGGGGQSDGDGGGGETETKLETRAPEGDDEDFIENATAEELAEIDADPRLKKLRASMTRDYKAKTTKVAERQRKFEEREAEIAERETMASQAMQLIDALRDDPEQVIRELARRRGLTIAQATKEVKEVETDKELVDLFGEKAGEVAPLLDRYIDRKVAEKTAGVRMRVEQQDVAAQQREIAVELKGFQAELKEKGEEVTPEMEKEMIALMEEMPPGEKANVGKYVRRLYKIVAGDKTKSEVAKEVTTRMKKAVNETEAPDLPTGRTKGGSSVTDGMSLREALRAARKDIRAGR